MFARLVVAAPPDPLLEALQEINYHGWTECLCIGCRAENQFCRAQRQVTAEINRTWSYLMSCLAED
jgi:hypothetical protein